MKPLIALLVFVFAINACNLNTNKKTGGISSTNPKEDFMKGSNYVNEKNWGLAKVNLERIPSSDENYSKAQELLKECYKHLDSLNFVKGMEAYNQKKWIEAEENFKNISKHYPVDSNILIKIKKEILLYNEKQEKLRAENERKEEQKFLNSKAGKIWKFCQKKNAVVTKEDCIKASEDRIWIGMNIWLLVARRGNPSSVNPSNYGYGTKYQYCWWDYTPSCFYDDDEDRLVDAYN
ncbi:MAG TPA: hypothetical protein VHP32_03610 [Ignavibacteria bacterium]|nr:hypothetical protein [Ignavibacteria bacterium]